MHGFEADVKALQFKTAFLSVLLNMMY